MFGRIKLTLLLLSSLIVLYGLLGGLMDKVAAGNDVYGDLSIFTEVLNRVRTEYVEQPDMQRALKGALHGMMEALDPYSSFVDAETFERLNSRQDFGASVGIIAAKRYGYAYVVAVHPESPAAREGIRTGDMIESIEGQVTTQMSLWEVQALLRGPAHSSVDLRVIRSRRSRPQRLVLQREPIETEEVSARIVRGKIGLLRIPHFEQDIVDEVRSKLNLLKSSDINGLLVDIRGSAGGDVRVAVNIADLFLPEKSPVLLLQRRDGEKEELLAASEALLTETPVTVLLDGGSSGPAEVFAAALRDNDVAQMVGERSNGRGSVQDEYRMEDGSVLIISTHILYRPDGQPLQRQELRTSGITPDVRSPAPDFVTSFYFENTPEESEGDPGEDFYRRLDQAIEEEQMKTAIRQLEERIQRAESGKSEAAQVTQYRNLKENKEE